MQDKQKVTLYLPPFVHRLLKIRAAIDDQNMSTIVEKAIEFYLKHPEKIEEVKGLNYEKTHQVHIDPEFEAVLRELQAVLCELNLRYVSITLNLFPEQYIQLRRTANSMISWKTLLSKTLGFEKKFQVQNIAFNNPLKTVYESLDKTNVQEFLGNDGQAWYIRGILLTSLKRYEEAISSFDIALKLNPDHQKAWYKRGIAYYAIDFYEMAIESFKKALELDPNDYLSWYSLGKSWLELENNKKALECFNKSLEINDDFELAGRAKMVDQETYPVRIYPTSAVVTVMQDENIVSRKHEYNIFNEQDTTKIPETTQEQDYELEIIVL